MMKAPNFERGAFVLGLLHHRELQVQTSDGGALVAPEDTGPVVRGDPANPLQLHVIRDPRVFGSETGRFALYCPDKAYIKRDEEWNTGRFLVIQDNAPHVIRGYPSRSPAAAWRFAASDPETAMGHGPPMITIWNDHGTAHTGTGPVNTDPPTLLAYDPTTKQVRAVNEGSIGNLTTVWMIDQVNRPRPGQTG